MATPAKWQQSVGAALCMTSSHRCVRRSRCFARARNGNSERVGKPDCRGAVGKVGRGGSPCTRPRTATRGVAAPGFSTARLGEGPGLLGGLQSDPSLEGCRMSLLCDCHDAPRNGTVISDQFNIPSGPVLGVPPHSPSPRAGGPGSLTPAHSGHHPARPDPPALARAAARTPRGLWARRGCRGS